MWEYPLTASANEWKQGSATDFGVTVSNVTPTDLKKVFVNGNQLAEGEEEDYTVGPGSVIVKFTPKFLATLSVGDHAVKMEFTNGVATMTLKVSPAGGGLLDDPIVLAAIVAVAIGAVIVAVYFLVIRKP